MIVSSAGTETMTFGSLERLKSSWKIRALPQVMLRLKRWFPQARSSNGDSILLSMTPAHSHELAWIMDRYPLQCDPDDYLELLSLSEVQEAREKSIALVNAGKAKPPSPAIVPIIEARDYQKTAGQLCYQSGSLLLADALGLGKTRSAIELLTYEGCLPAIVVVPTHLTKQWRDELARFTPTIRSHITSRMSPYPWPDGEPPDVVITNWFKIIGWADRLLQEGIYKTLILDEVHELRHFDTERYRAVSSVRAMVERCMGMSASPIYNYGGEIWSVMNVIAPDALGSRHEFAREWCGTTDEKGKLKVSDPRALGIHLRSANLMLRRTREDVNRELPKLSRVVQMVDANPEHITEITDELTTWAKTLLSSKTTSLDKMQAGGQFDMRLRQATGIAKAPHVAHFVKMLLEEGERVVLFAWHHEVYRIYEEMLKDHNPVFYTGAQTTSQKEEAKQKFISKETNLLIMSIRSGVGVDGLQGSCNVCVFGELDWSPAACTQAIGRIHRDGQDKATFAYFLLSEAGSDPVMSDVLRLKASQAEGIVDPTADFVEKDTVDPEHVKKLARAFLAKHGKQEE